MPMTVPKCPISSIVGRYSVNLDLSLGSVTSWCMTGMMATTSSLSMGGECSGNKGSSGDLTMPTCKRESGGVTVGTIVFW